MADGRSLEDSERERELEIEITDERSRLKGGELSQVPPEELAADRERPVPCGRPRSRSVAACFHRTIMGCMACRRARSRPIHFRANQ